MKYLCMPLLAWIPASTIAPALFYYLPSMAVFTGMTKLKLYSTAKIIRHSGVGQNPCLPGVNVYLRVPLLKLCASG